MLANLYVSDLALIKSLSVDLHRGFSVLTGETGAGKSLILDSLNLFLVSRGASELVRDGAEKMEVSLFFDNIGADAAAALSDLFSPEEIAEGITLTRIVTKDGKSTCKAGMRTLPFSRVSEMAKALLSIHGQHASGGLLDEKNHGRYLDDALDESGKACLQRYGALYEAYAQAKKHLEELEGQVGSEEETLALIDYQMNQIARVKPRAGEEEALEKRLAEIQSREKIHAALSVCDRALSGGDRGRGAVFLLEAAANKLEALGEEDPQYPLAAELFDLARRASDAAKDVSYRLSGLGDEDPAQLAERIRARLDALYRLKLKYGGTVEEVLDRYAELKRKKDLTLSLKDDIKRATATLRSAEKALSEGGKALSEARRACAEKLEKEIGSVLAFLDMPKMRFFVERIPCPPFRGGAERIRFAISPNTGEGVKALSQVASGGELSRIMLALQLKLGRAKDADTMIFDEVDTGISGATAQKIGIALKTLSVNKQVICVTHSPQVSTLADQHYRVEKREEDGRTVTGMTLLSARDALLENARLLGGATVSKEAEDAAARLQQDGTQQWKKWKDTVL